MDEKDLNKNLEENPVPDKIEETVQKDSTADIQNVTDTEETAGDQNNSSLDNTPESDDTSKKKDDSEWAFDGQVHTDLNNLDLKYSGQEIILNDIGTSAPNQEDVITIDKSKVRKVFKIIGGVIVCLVVALALAFAVFFGLFAPNTSEINTPANTALKVDGRNVSVGEYNYYYSTFTSESKMQQYQQYLGLDTTKSYEEQYFDADAKQTWTDFFEQSTIDQIKYITALSEKAKDAKVKLSDDQKESIKTEIDTIKSQAGSSNISVKEYLAQNYGENVGIKTIKNIMTRSFLAQNYYQQEQANKQYTNEEVSKYYDENSDDFVTTAFRYIPFAYTSTDEATKTDAKAKAEAFLNEVTSEQDFLTVAKKYVTDDYVNYLNDQYTKITGLAKTDTNIPSDIREWLYTDGVAVNDKNVFLNEDQSCYYAVLAVATPGKDETKLYSVRHILSKVKTGDSQEDTSTSTTSTTEESTTAAPTEKQWAECKEAAEKIIAEFNKTDKSQFAFAELAEKYSEDTESTSAGTSGSYGGLYSQVPLGQMVPEFEGWATDSTRKYGDIGLVKTDYGYHVIFFVTNQESWKFSVESAILDSANKETIANAKSTKKAGFKKCTVAKVDGNDEETTTKNGATDSTEK